MFLWRVWLIIPKLSGYPFLSVALHQLKKLKKKKKKKKQSKTLLVVLELRLLLSRKKYQEKVPYFFGYNNFLCVFFSLKQSQKSRSIL